MEDCETTKVLVISIVGLLFIAGIQWLAFWLSRRPKTKKFPYGLNRSEDIAGLFILPITSLSILIVMYESITRMFHGTEPNNLWVVSVAATM